MHRLWIAPFWSIPIYLNTLSGSLGIAVTTIRYSQLPCSKMYVESVQKRESSFLILLEYHLSELPEERLVNNISQTHMNYW